MKKSQIANVYLLELAAAFRPELREVLPDLLDPALARGARDLIMGVLHYRGWNAALMGLEATRVAQLAMRQPDPLKMVKAMALANPLALSDDEAALRSWGFETAEARALASTAKGKRAARAVSEGRYEEADQLLACV